MFFRFGHQRQPARLSPEVTAAALLMRRWPDQGRQGSLNEVAFRAAVFHERVRHRRPPHVEPIRRILRWRRARAEVLVEAAPERARMRRRRAHAGPLLVVALPFDHLASAGGGDRNGTVRGD